jgi:hypothetical protein
MARIQSSTSPSNTLIPLYLEKRIFTSTPSTQHVMDLYTVFANLHVFSVLTSTLYCQLVVPYLPMGNTLVPSSCPGSSCGCGSVLVCPPATCRAGVVNTFYYDYTRSSRSCTHSLERVTDRAGKLSYLSTVSLSGTVVILTVRLNIVLDCCVSSSTVLDRRAHTSPHTSHIWLW